jgi:hypothetical protein
MDKIAELEARIARLERVIGLDFVRSWRSWRPHGHRNPPVAHLSPAERELLGVSDRETFQLED